MRPDILWSMGALIIACVGIVLTTFVIIIFIKYIDAVEDAIPMLVLQEYKQYISLFIDKLEIGLLEYIQQDYIILLKEGIQPKFYKIYYLNKEKLRALREYLKDNL